MKGDMEVGLFHLLPRKPMRLPCHHSVAERSQTVTDMVGLSSLICGPGSLYEEIVL